MTQTYVPEAVRDSEGYLTLHRQTIPALNGVPHPFPYQGSKRALAHTLMQFIPRDTARLVEPFAGSAAVSIAARYLGLVSSTTINDVNAPLMSLWRRIVSDADNLSREYEELWLAGVDKPKEHFLALREKFNAEPDAAALLYLLNRIVKGAVRYSKNGAFNQSADNRRLGARPKVVRERLLGTSGVMSGTTVLSQSYEDVLLSATDHDVVYMDPPYQGVTNVRDHRYMAGLLRKDYEAVLYEANARDLSYIISYDAVRADGKYGEPLDGGLDLTHLHVVAGRSAQSTLSGGNDVTVESVYLSPALVRRLGGQVETTLF